MSRRKGFISFDVLFSGLVIVLMLFMFVNYVAYSTREVRERMMLRVKFNRIVAIADYVVRTGAAEREKVGGGGVLGGVLQTSVKRPGKIDTSRLPSASELEDWKNRVGLDKLVVEVDSLDSQAPPSFSGVCVYRVVVDEQEEIKKLYVCGG